MKKEFHCTFTLLKNACTHTLNRERILLCDFTLYIYWGEQNNRSSYVEGLACTDWLWKKKKKEKRNFYLRTHFHGGRSRESKIGWARSYFTRGHMETSSFPMKFQQNLRKWENFWTFFMSLKFMQKCSKLYGFSLKMSAKHSFLFYCYSKGNASIKKSST